MKNLFLFFVAVLLSAPAFSQNSVESLRVENHTDCRQYYNVIGSESCVCKPHQHYQGGIIFIDPGEVRFHTAANLGGNFQQGGKIVAARILTSSPPPCGTWDEGTVEQPGCDVSGSSVHVYVAKPVNCNQCFADPNASILETRATWIPADCNGQARLIFTPN